MGRYIDADDAIYRLEKMSYSDSQPRAIRRAGKYLDAFANDEAADVEKVVRCKDCKFRYTQTCFAKHETADNDFCSCGAKMDGGKE